MKKILDEIKEAYEIVEDTIDEPTIYTHNNRKYMWAIEVYEEWYDYDILNGYKGSFEGWFKPDSFAEPLKEKAVAVSKKGNKLTLVINLGYDTHRILTKVQNAIFHFKENTNLISRAECQPNMHKIRLTSMKEDRLIYSLKQTDLKNLEVAYKADILKTKYDTKTQKDRAISSKEVYDFKTSLLTKDRKKLSYEDAFTNACEKRIENAEQKIQKAVRRVKKVLKNVENGTFP